MYSIRIENKNQLDEGLDKIWNKFEELPEGQYEITISKPTRSVRQNNSLHLWFDWIAKALNESGNYLSNEFFSESYESQWDSEMVKELIFRNLIKRLYQVESTTELTTEQHTHAVKVINDWLGTSKNIIMQYPNELDRSLDIKNYEIIK